MYIVSIVMPVFNARKYIEKTISSIMNQTFKDFELIIIDDGATDGTGDICKKYAKEYANIKYFNQINQGVCAARNYGISLSTGKYIAFLDHDDEYLNNYLEVLVKLIEHEKLDLVKCGVYYEETYVDGSFRVKQEEFEEKIYTKKELINRYNILPISYFGVWNGLYKASILKENNILFPLDVKYGQEDYFFNTEILPYISKVGFTKQCLYKHYRRVKQSTSAKFYLDRIYDMEKYMRKEIEVLRPYFDNESWNKEYSILYIRKITGLLSYCLNTLEEDVEIKCCEYIKNFVNSNPFNAYISFSTYVKIFKHSPKYALVLYMILHKKYNLTIKLWNLKNKKLMRTY